MVHSERVSETNILEETKILLLFIIESLMGGFFFPLKFGIFILG